MCSTPYDCRVPANINRPNDYRGFSQMYRGGSVFTHERSNVYQPGIRGANSVGCPGEYFCNAGDYGVTTPVSTKRRDFDDDSIPTRPHWGGGAIAIPQDDPGKGYNYEPRSGGSTVPSVNEIIKQPRGTSSGAVPVTPPAKQKMPPRTLDPLPIDTIPFSPNDEVVPQDPFPKNLEVDMPFSLEELRRLDPSVKDVQIISIEDAGVETLVR